MEIEEEKLILALAQIFEIPECCILEHPTYFIMELTDLINEPKIQEIYR